MQIPSKARAVIIGGGVIGCSIAYHLGKLGWKDVVLLERKQLTCGTTWHAAGLIAQLRATQNMTRLAKYSQELYFGLEAETGVATGFKRNGSITVALTDERMEELRRARVVDVAVETVGGNGDTLMQAQLIVRPKGKVLVLGVFSGGPVNINPLHLAAREVEIIGSMTYARSEGHADYQIALNIIQDYAEESRCLVTHRFSLDEVNTAFATALDKTSKSIKVCLLYTSDAADE